MECIHEGQYLKAYLKEKGVKVKELAEKLGINRLSVNHAFNQMKVNSSFKNRLIASGFIIPNLHNDYQPSVITPIPEDLKLLVSLKNTNDLLTNLVNVQKSNLRDKDLLIEQLQCEIIRLKSAPVIN